MIRTLALASLASALVLSSIGCSEAKETSTPTTKVAEKAPALPEMTVSEVAALISKPGAKVAVLDANGLDTRTSQGVLPGATLLSNYREYDVKELPTEKDTKLIFYCGSTSCSASDKAAVRAKENGYSDVCVMRAGIEGWKKEGQKTAEFKPAVAK